MSKSNLLNIISMVLEPYHQSDDFDKLTKIYILAVDGIPEQFIIEASKLFIQGIVSNYNPAFAPKPAQLAKEARRLWDIEIVKKDREIKLKRQQLALSEPEFKPTEAEKERVDKLIKSSINGMR